MKNLKYILFIVVLFVVMIVGFSFCSDSFLDEKNKLFYIIDYFKML